MARRKKGGKAKKRPATPRPAPGRRDAAKGAADGHESDDGAPDDGESDEDEGTVRAADGDGPDADEAQGEPPDDDEPPPSEPISEPPSSSGTIGLPSGASWGLPLVRFERRWTWLETRIMFASLLALTLVLSAFFSMRGMKEPLEAAESAGTVFRAMVGALVLGGLSRAFTRGRPDKIRNVVTVVAIAVGLGVAPLWRGVGIDYWDGVFNWLQGGSTLTLFGGLWGLSTRLTMFVAMLGASIAAASGTHINIDVVIRLIPLGLRRPVGIAAAVATAAVCFAASWGFLDHIAITSFRADDKATGGEKVEAISEGVGEMFFAFRKQVGLDFGAIPYVITGDRWDDPDRMKGRDWNAWLDDAGFVDRYGEEKVAALRAPEGYLEEGWVPFVQLPDHDPRSGFMKEIFDLATWPLGFFFLGIRFLLRALLIAAGHVSLRIEGDGEGEDDLSGAEEAA